MHPTKRIKGSKGSSLNGKTVVLGVTGSIAAVKCIELARELVRRGAEVHAVMSEQACRIIHPNAMHYATGNPVVTELSGSVEHIGFCGANGTADLLLIAPCTANTLGKIVFGIDDTPVSSLASTALGSKKKILVVPAMHYSMYENEFVAENIARLRELGVIVLKPRVEENSAKFPQVEEIVLECERALSRGLLRGKRVLVASGPTQEDVDAIRVLTNRASGLTGREIALECYRQQADVCIVHNHEGIARGIKSVRVRTGLEMQKAVLNELKKGYDLYISPAAVTDFSVKKVEGKIESGKKATIHLRPRPKLVEIVKQCFPMLEVVAFKAVVGVPERQMVELAREKMRGLKSKLLVVNDVEKGGMGTLSNRVLIVSSKGVRAVDGLKSEIARAIVEEIAALSTKEI